MALVKNNAKIGSLIAVELCRIRKLKEKKAVVSYNNVIATLSLIPFARVSVWLRMLFTYDGVSVIIKRRAIRSSRNQTNRIGRKISVLLTIPSPKIQWKLDCRSHKPLDGLKTGITIGCLFRFCMRRRQSCFRWFISIVVLSGIARK